jgi:hypothetical protein
MKNIHILPTDKPSRLIKSQDNDFVYLNTNAPNWFENNLKTIKQNIYITNSEEIKEETYFLEPINNSVLKLKDNSDKLIKSIFPTCKKIIITTDQDLIKDGVQAIEDEFLEWFIKNPSCEEVEVVPYLESITDPITNEDYPIVQYRHFDLNKMICKYKYKIIIPITSQQIIDEDFAGGLDMGQISAKQESKQDRTCSNNCSTICGECQIFEFRPISGLEWLLGYIEELNKKGYKFIPSSKKEIVEHVTQMEKDNMINFLKSVFQQDNFNYEKAYNEFINKKRV